MPFVPEVLDPQETEAALSWLRPASQDMPSERGQRVFCFVLPGAVRMQSAAAGP